MDAAEHPVQEARQEYARIGSTYRWKRVDLVLIACLLEEGKQTGMRIEVLQYDNVHWGNGRRRFATRRQVEAKDRGLYDFIGKKEEDHETSSPPSHEEVLVSKFEDKVTYTEREEKPCRRPSPSHHRQEVIKIFGCIPTRWKESKKRRIDSSAMNYGDDA